MRGRSHTWTDSFVLAGRLPMTRLVAVNGATLPLRVVSAGRDDAPATPLAPAIVMPATTAVAPTAAVSLLVLRMIPLSWSCGR